uniref:Uncharacterized protein n=1 Tax=Strigamia maritima TaxID=126957 RepID=T1IH01_STRMM
MGPVLRRICATDKRINIYLKLISQSSNSCAKDVSNCQCKNTTIKWEKPGLFSTVAIYAIMKPHACPACELTCEVTPEKNLSNVVCVLILVAKEYNLCGLESRHSWGAKFCPVGTGVRTKVICPDYTGSCDWRFTYAVPVRSRHSADRKPVQSGHNGLGPNPAMQKYLCSPGKNGLSR